MQHRVHNKKTLNNSSLLLDIELFPDNETEKEAIRQVEACNANDEQRQLVENYLLFGLKVPYSILGVERQKNTRFLLKASLH